MPYTGIGAIGVMTLAGNAQMANPANVMTLNNEVMLCGDCTLTAYTAGSVFATLSEESTFPSEPVIIPVCVTADGQTRLVPLSISSEGGLSLPYDYSTSAVVHLNGIVFTANSRYYNPEIGNIYNDGTSPLTENRY